MAMCIACVVEVTMTFELQGSMRELRLLLTDVKADTTDSEPIRAAADGRGLLLRLLV